MTAARVRSVFISDVHLGTRACQAERLLDFLRAYPSEYLYMVGDILDFWAMKREVRWTGAQNTVVQKVLRRARHGERVMFIPGNHDELLREHVGIRFGGIRLEREWVHTAADGRRYLLVHGDEFDPTTARHRWLAIAGDISYTWLVRINTWLSWARRRLGFVSYWSLASYAKHKVKAAVSFIGDFERTAALAARDRGMDGVICGHIHVAAIREVEGVTYVNCGDWVDNCTAIVEHHDGRLERIDWSFDDNAREETPALPVLQDLLGR